MSEIEPALAQGEDVSKVIDAVFAATGEFPTMHVLMALLSMVFIIQMPEIEDRQLHDGVKGASQWIAQFLTRCEDETFVGDTGTPPSEHPPLNLDDIPKGKMN